MHRLILAIISIFGGIENATAGFDVYGFAASRLGQVHSPPGWLEGGFGRFDQGRDPAGTQGGDQSAARDSFAVIDGQVAVDWHLGERLLTHVHALARREESLSATDELGLIEAYLLWRVKDEETHALSASFGLRFFPTSLENTDDLWQSPYTLSYSVWNSWIAHEFRPIGLQLNYTHNLASGARIGVVVSAFQGNDSSGAELAWGGWRHSQRLSTLGEVLPLPDLVSLREGNTFQAQRNDGSKPFGPDLDDRVGFAAQLNFRTERFRLNLSHIANNGDRALYRGEYAWDTEFTNFGLRFHVNQHWTVLGEYATGQSGMGVPGMAVDIDFDTAYLMLSFNQRQHRITARVEQFRIDDRDGVITDNSEDGESFTLAYLYSPGQWRIGIEYLETNVDRTAALQSGFDPRNDGEQISLELRYVF